MPKMYFRCAVLGGAGGFASFPPNPPFTSALGCGESRGALVAPNLATCKVGGLRHRELVPPGHQNMNFTHTTLHSTNIIHYTRATSNYISPAG